MRDDYISVHEKLRSVLGEACSGLFADVMFGNGEIVWATRKEFRLAPLAAADEATAAAVRNELWARLSSVSQVLGSAQADNPLAANARKIISYPSEKYVFYADLGGGVFDVVVAGWGCAVKQARPAAAFAGMPLREAAEAVAKPRLEDPAGRAQQPVGGGEELPRHSPLGFVDRLNLPLLVSVGLLLVLLTNVAYAVGGEFVGAGVNLLKNLCLLMATLVFLRRAVEPQASKPLTWAFAAVVALRLCNIAFSQFPLGDYPSELVRISYVATYLTEIGVCVYALAKCQRYKSVVALVLACDVYFMGGSVFHAVIDNPLDRTLLNGCLRFGENVIYPLKYAAMFAAVALPAGSVRGGERPAVALRVLGGALLAVVAVLLSMMLGFKEELGEWTYDMNKYGFDESLVDVCIVLFPVFFCLSAAVFLVALAKSRPAWWRYVLPGVAAVGYILCSVWQITEMIDGHEHDLLAVMLPALHCFAAYLLAIGAALACGGKAAPSVAREVAVWTGFASLIAAACVVGMGLYGYIVGFAFIVTYCLSMVAVVCAYLPMSLRLLFPRLSVGWAAAVSAVVFVATALLVVLCNGSYNFYKPGDDFFYY